MALWLWFEAGFDKFLDKYLPFEDSWVEPIENCIGMELGGASRAFFPLALLIQLFFVCAHSTNGFHTINYAFRLGLALGSFLSVFAMFCFSVDSFLAIAAKMRLKQMPRARNHNDAASSIDFMIVLAFISIFLLLFSIHFGGFFGWYLGLNVTMAMIAAATTMKHVQACYILSNEEDLPKVIEEQERLKAQSRKIIKMESTIEGQNYRLYHGIENLEEQAWKLALEKQDLAAELLAKKSRIENLEDQTLKLSEENKDLTSDNADRKTLVEKLLDTRKEYERLIDWYSGHFTPDQNLIKRLSSEKSELESQNRQLTKTSAELREQKTALESRFTMLERAHLSMENEYAVTSREQQKAIREVQASSSALTKTHDGLICSIQYLKFENKTQKERSSRVVTEFQAQVELLKQDNERLRTTQETWVNWYHEVVHKLASYDQACSKNAELEEQLNICHITLEACRLTLAKRDEELQRSQSLQRQFQDLWMEATEGADDEAEEESEADDDSDVGSYAEVDESASEVEYDESNVEILTEGDSDDEMRHWALVDSDNEL